MKIAVRYYTRTGSTKRLAEAIGQAIGVEALPISVPLAEPVDILFLGSSFYTFDIDHEVRDFIRGLDKNKVGKIVNFGTAVIMASTFKKVKEEADKVGIRMDKREFHCKGEYKDIYTGKPDQKDLDKAAAFAKTIVG
ncbi:MAG: flavodoxin [Lachnospiraceae bacterium]|nr:flavodoxin [Lachnospiraceae bacterium]